MTVCLGAGRQTAEKVREIVCREERRRGFREDRNQIDGTNKYRQGKDGSAGGEKDSVWEIRGSNKLSRARQAKSSSQSIHFFVSVLKVQVKAPLWVFGGRISDRKGIGYSSHGCIKQLGM